MDRIWLKSYPPGVPAEIEVDQRQSLVTLFDEACRKFADKVAYISMGREMTYGELDRQARDFAGWLQSIGLRKGDRVALMLPNLLQYPVALFGTLRAGCVGVNVNPLSTPRELEHQLNDAGAVAIVIVENFAHTLEKVIARTRVRHVVVTAMGDLLGPLRGAVVNFVVRRIRKLVVPWTLPGAISFPSALASGRRHGLQAVAIAQHDLALLQYTGGTTGIAKGAMLTHGNMVANVLQAHAWIKPVVAEGRELVLTSLPLYHIFALTANCLTFLMIGARNLLIANPRDLGGLIKTWSRYPVTVTTGVNTLFNALLNHPDFAKLDLSALKFALGGGMAVQASLAGRWQEVTGTPLLQAYGLTETAPAVTINPLDLKVFNASIGLPIPSTEVAIRDEYGQDKPGGQVGEICVRGPQVMAGYWQRPEETANVMDEDGFLRTGDLGYVDPLGFFYLVDRKKDVIIVSGFNVYPNEVEEVVAMHEGVNDVAAVGIRDDDTGEAVKIFVVRRDPALTAEALIAHCRQYLSAYKVPRQIEFRADLPRTNVGKILRRALKAEG